MKLGKNKILFWIKSFGQWMARVEAALLHFQMRIKRNLREIIWNEVADEAWAHYQIQLSIHQCNTFLFFNDDRAYL